jgi:hypothetical protein
VRAEAAVATLAAEPDQKVQATLWRGMTADKASGAELERFSAAVQPGAATTPVRAMRRSGGGIVEAASAPRQHRAALAAVSCTVHPIQEGEFDSARQDHQPERLAQRQALGHRRGLRP